MRSSAGAAWRVAPAMAFVATAALAVGLSRGMPLRASLVSTHNGTSASAPAIPANPADRPWCGPSRLRIRVKDTGMTLSYAVEFTNVSASPCVLSGYPSVSAYGASGAQVGNAAGRDATVAVARVVLAPGGSADASVIASGATLRAQRCHPVAAFGLHIVPPGGTAGPYVRHALTACSVSGRHAPVFLRVLALQADSQGASRVG